MLGGYVVSQIFLVEDDLDHAELITTFLKVGGIENEIIWFKDAESTIERIMDITKKELELPIAIIIDLKLPRMSGFDLISNIRDIDRFKNVPIIVISSSSQPSDISRAYKMGAVEYINKLTAMDYLAERIRAYI